MQGEVVAAYPGPGKRAEPLRHVRSTIVASGISALRHHGHFDAYAAALDAASREVLVTTVAGAWMPIQLAITHYRACDAIQLTHDEVVAIGREVGERVHQNVLHAVKTLATGVGVTPWTLAAQYDRLYPRMFDGGGFRIVRLGPKDGVIELLQCPLAESTYFRSAFCGVNLAGMKLVATKAYVRPQSHHGPHAFAVRLSWV
jgi:hypothetical protein